MYIFVVVQLIPFIASLSAGKTADDGDSNCDAVVCPSKIPVNMPNIDYFLRGYNILKGNPLEVSVSIVDPGYQEGIFKLRHDKGGLTPDGLYLQPDGTLITMCESCDLSFETRKMSGTKAYQENLSVKVSVAGHVGGVLSFFDKASFSLSVGFQDIKRHTSERSSLFTHSDASCCAYQIQTNTYAPPPFSEDFKVGMNSLTDDYDKDIYLRFIEAFGTHYVRQANMGSLYGQQCMISSEGWESMISNKINIEQTASATIESSIHIRDKDRFKLYEEHIKQFNENSSSQTLYTIGSKPPFNGTVNEWVQETKVHPAPIKVVLSSILDLLGHNDCVSKKVQGNMKKALTDYCGLACTQTTEDPPYPTSSVWKPWLTNNNMGKIQVIQPDCSNQKNNWISTLYSLSTSLHWTCENKKENGTIKGGNVGSNEITCPAGIKQMRAFVSNTDKTINNLEIYCHDDTLPQLTTLKMHTTNGSWTNWISCNLDKKIMSFQTLTKNADELLNIRFRCYSEEEKQESNLEISTNNGEGSTSFTTS